MIVGQGNFFARHQVQNQRLFFLKWLYEAPFFFFFSSSLNMNLNLLANVPSLTKVLVSTVLLVSITSYIYTYQQILEDDQTPLAICPYIGLLPGL